jgi:hypothetical protein
VRGAHPYDNEVQQSINTCAFEFGFSRVLHQFGVFASKNNHSIAPLCVPQNAASENHFVIIQGMTAKKFTQSINYKFLR